MDILTPIQHSNSQIAEAATPRTAVFVGATDGIGRNALSELVSTGSPLKIYIIGRDKTQHQHVVEELHAINTNATLIYLEGQISLMSEVKRITDDINRREQKIDLFYHSAGFLPFTGRQETAEGLELASAVAHYSRFVFISRLLPRLRAAAGSSYGARVISVLAAGRESTDLFLDDLSLEEAGHFDVPTYARHVATMVTSTMEQFAKKSENKDVVFLHAYPGSVATNLLQKSWGGQKPSGTLLSGPQGGLSRRWTVEEAGQKVLYLMTSAEYGGKGVAVPETRSSESAPNQQAGGALFAVNDMMEILQQETMFRQLQEEGAPDAIWDFTVKSVASWLP